MKGQSPEKLNVSAANFNEWYDASIEWEGRLGREIPLLMEVLGPPGEGGIIDAGCGSGRHVCALAQKGYQVVGADNSEEMLTIARRHAGEMGVDIRLVNASYETLRKRVGGGFDGVFCLANSLAAAGTAPAVAQAIDQFASCLRPGGRFFIELLNFTPMLDTIKGDPPAPLSANDRTEIDPSSGFELDPTRLCVTNIKINAEKTGPNEPRPFALYPVSNTEMDEWCTAAGLRIDERWGSFLHEPFEVDRSIDQIVIGTRNSAESASDGVS